MVRPNENARYSRFPMEVGCRLEHISRKLGRTKRLLVMQMVDYFYRSKKDPAELNDEVLKKVLSSSEPYTFIYPKTRSGSRLGSYVSSGRRVKCSLTKIICTNLYV